MNLNLRRKLNSEVGIFGQLANDAGDLVAYTLEHAYSDKGFWAPKIPIGVYICKREIHKIEDGKGPFETFRITGIPGYDGPPNSLLFHKGNYNRDSKGCVLLGSYIYGNALVQSTQAFEKFMALMDGVDAFRLTVS